MIEVQRPDLVSRWPGRLSGMFASDGSVGPPLARLGLGARRPLSQADPQPGQRPGSPQYEMHLGQVEIWLVRSKDAELGPGRTLAYTGGPFTSLGCLDDGRSFIDHVGDHRFSVVDEDVEVSARLRRLGLRHSLKRDVTVLVADEPRPKPCESICVGTGNRSSVRFARRLHRVEVVVGIVGLLNKVVVGVCTCLRATVVGTTGVLGLATGSDLRRSCALATADTERPTR